LPLLPKNPRRGKHHRGHHLARGGGGSRARWTFPDRSPAAWIQKGRGAVRGEGKTNHPHWGFPPPRFGGGLGEEEGGRACAAAPRRWGKKAGGPCCCVRGTRQEPRTGGAKRQGQRREHGPRRRVKGGARRRGHLHRRNAITPEPLRPIFVRPATPTPTPHREHHGHPLLFSPLCSCYVSACMEARRREPVVWNAGLRAVAWPCRDGWRSWADRDPERRRRRAKGDAYSGLWLGGQRRGDAPRPPQAGGRVLPWSVLTPCVGRMSVLAFEPCSFVQGMCVLDLVLNPCAGAGTPPCRRSVRPGYQASAPAGQAWEWGLSCEPDFDPCPCAGGKGGRHLAASPWRAGDGGVEPGHRGNAPSASRGHTSSRTWPANTPQCQSRAVSCCK
jgi:hypothetical protein